MNHVLNASRRAFLAATAAGAAGYSSIALFQSRANASAGSTESARLSHLEALNSGEFTSDTFTELQGTCFSIRDADGLNLQAELMEVADLALNSADDRPASFRPPFSLMFRLPEGRRLPQSICHVEHQQLGQFELFLVPVSLPAGVFNAEAIFA